ncbi:hypothetical protein ASPWEDRAFT_169794 [Aspergillus wentii DTO 134E9]|uniref:Methyltransferase type 11 domain-containing protein n=1 Tax=Aspergillus wentii DTO 134E9 TaxID=1073089 RepID=A0A1L9RYD0_ASPWE|nr:uncharacterized protein ASPWEDRAFT_169794 [Aspergillus wentii DTO 134E9]OJJ39970.1 hypothetical protein ASPWEDRAFT_169794 [Aspergillus wentii DTO 134E9]
MGTLRNAPPPQWLLESISLQGLSLLDPVPEHLIEKYDFIHLRLLILIVQNSDPVPIIKNADRMLKPGGNIQWDDLNYPDTNIFKVDSEIQMPALDELRQFVYSKWTA